MERIVKWDTRIEGRSHLRKHPRRNFSWCTSLDQLEGSEMLRLKMCGANGWKTLEPFQTRGCVLVLVFCFVGFLHVRNRWPRDTALNAREETAPWAPGLSYIGICSRRPQTIRWPNMSETFGSTGRWLTGFHIEVINLHNHEFLYENIPCLPVEWSATH